MMQDTLGNGLGLAESAVRRWSLGTFRGLSVEDCGEYVKDEQGWCKVTWANLKMEIKASWILY